MIEPAVVDITIYQGATWDYPIILKSGDPLLPVDLTGCSARMQARVKYTSADRILTLDTGATGGIALGGSAGTIDLAMTATATAALLAGKAVYDLEIIHPDTTVTRLMMGKLTISQEVP